MGSVSAQVGMRRSNGPFLIIRGYNPNVANLGCQDAFYFTISRAEQYRIRIIAKSYATHLPRRAKWFLMRSKGMYAKARQEDNLANVLTSDLLSTSFNLRLTHPRHLLTITILKTLGIDGCDSMGNEEPPDQCQNIGIDIVQKIARFEGTDETDLPPLGESINLDAVEELIESPTDAELSFSYYNYRITVDDSREISISKR